MSEYVYPKDALPEIEYPTRPTKTCGGCCSGYITNPGAVIPGYHCNLIEYLFNHKGIPNGNASVDRYWGTCKFHNIPLASIKDMRVILFMENGNKVK